MIGRNAVRFAALLSFGLAGIGGMAGAADRLAAPTASPVLALTLPRPVAPGEALWLRVKVGPLPAAAALVVRTADGRAVGAVSPFGGQARRSGGTYFLPLPADAAPSGEVRLVLTVKHDDAPPRAPTAAEVTRVDLVTVPVAR
ncbi:MAG: hypothetical protein GC191_07020 [Azospirillum sp.]|nr:hypothetical protein [Azospirillum sp.]